jgi:tetratricopeptide (TPR) repeat protein
MRRGVAILLIALFAVDTSSRAHTWGSPFDLWSSEADHHPASARANTELGDIYAFYGSITTDNPATKETSYLPARQYYEQAAAVNKNDVNGLFGLIGLSATHGKVVEKSWLNELAYRLESKAIDASVNSQLITLTRCKMQDTCTLTNDEIESLLNAPLRNPKVSGRDKALIYSALTYYFFNVTHNYPAAIEATHRSIELAPQELEFRVSLATILIAAKRFDEAREQILALKQLDKQGRLMQEITAFEKQLPQSS